MRVAVDRERVPSLPDRFVLVAALVAEVMLCALISVGVSGRASCARVICPG